jgi:hypothetical protein
MADMVEAADAIVIGEARGAEPLVRRKPFVGQDGDFTPIFVDRSVALGLYATHVLPDTGEDFFLVLAYPPDEYPGLPGISIYGVFGEVAAPGDTQSYYSLDGGLTWSLEPGFEYGFGLVVAPL